LYFFASPATFARISGKIGLRVYFSKEFPEHGGEERVVAFFTWHILEVSPSHLACERPEERSSDRKWPDSPVQVKTKHGKQF